MIIAELELPWLFNSIRCEVGKHYSPYVDDKVYAHFCNNCQQVFLARFDMEYRGMASYWTGDVYRCPLCGKVAVSQERRYTKSTVGFAPDPDCVVPRSMQLRLHEFKNHIKLVIDAPAISFMQDTPELVRYHRIVETITLNLQEQRAYYQQRGGLSDVDKIELDNPTVEGSLPDSMLYYLRKNSRAWREYKGKVTQFTKVLREAVIRKLHTVKGYKMKSAAVPGDVCYGLMIHPIQNLIWRMIVPDGPNLKELFANKHIGQAIRSNVSKDEIKSILALCRSGLSYPQAVLKTLGLPDTKAGRQMIAGQPIYTVAVMKLVARANLSEHNRRLLYSSLMARYKKWASRTQLLFWSVSELFPDEDGLKFFLIAKEKVGEQKALHLLTDMPAKELNDTGGMYKEFTAKEKQTLWSKAGNVKSLHETCMEIQWLRKNPDYNLDVPEHIVNRLRMQKDSLKFYLPETYHQLHAAGKELHNCVGGGYPRRMKDGELCIVLVSDDSGKLKVCIELKGTHIQQAKLFNNKPVWKDPALLQTVLEWAKARGLTMNTQDLEPPKEKTDPGQMLRAV